MARGARRGVAAVRLKATSDARTAPDALEAKALHVSLEASPAASADGSEVRLARARREPAVRLSRHRLAEPAAAGAVRTARPQPEGEREADEAGADEEEKHAETRCRARSCVRVDHRERRRGAAWAVEEIRR